MANIQQPAVCSAPVTAINQRVWYCQKSEWNAYVGETSPTITGNLISTFPAALSKFLAEVAAGKKKLVEVTRNYVNIDGSMKNVHSVQLTINGKDAATELELDQMAKCQQIVVIIELDGIETEGKFKVFGADSGLELVDPGDFVQNEHENGGHAMITVRSNSDLQRVESTSGLNLWSTDVATTRALIEANTLP